MRKANSSVGKATREKILEVALDLIRSEGLAALTIRTIAERAGVNVAAVSYHFGSKEALVEEVLLTLTSALRSAFAHLHDEEAPPRRRLHRFLDELSIALLQHPEVYRQALAAGITTSSDEHKRYVSFVQSQGLQALKDTVRAVTQEPNRRRLTLRVVQAIGGLVYPLLVGSFVEEVGGVRVSDDAVRREHVEVCLQTLVGPEPR